MTTALAGALLIAVALAMARLLRGPTDADRVIALDILFAAGIGFCAVAALATGRALFLDVAIGVALVGFVATLAWARLVETRAAQDADR